VGERREQQNREKRVQITWRGGGPADGTEVSGVRGSSVYGATVRSGGDGSRKPHRSSLDRQPSPPRGKGERHQRLCIYGGIPYILMRTCIYVQEQWVHIQCISFLF